MRKTSLLAACTALLPVTAAVATDWPQFGRDGAHSGNNTAETTISAANVAQLVARYANPVVLPATVDSAPVYASGISTPVGVRDLLFAFGSDDGSDYQSSMGLLMAIDAGTGAIVWQKATSGSSQHASSSPAIDAGRQYVYSFGVDGFVHKYRIGDGVETVTPPVGWPARVTLKPDVEKVASGLTLSNMGGTNYLNVVTDGYNGDGGDYQGHVVSIDLGNGVATVFNAMCSGVATLLAQNGCPSGRMSGIWGRGGATFDSGTNRIYVTTGNGEFDANTVGGHNWGDSVLAFTPDGAGSAVGVPRDSYTPSTYQDLQDHDIDLGSVSLAILPAPSGSAVAHLGMQVGKDFQMRLINLDNMSGAGSAAQVGGELQILAVAQGGNGMREQPTVWVNPADQSTWVFVGNGAGLSGVQLGLNGSQPRLTTRWTRTLSATSPIVANGVLYSAGACSDGGTCVTARNPVTGGVLWSSAHIGGVHWQSPILVDGALYVTDNSGKLWKFALPLPDLIFKSGFES